MSKIRKQVAWLGRQEVRDVARIQKLEAELQAKTAMQYDGKYYGGFGLIRAEVPVVDVVNSILRYLQLEIVYKDCSVTPEARVIFKSTKKKVVEKSKTSKKSNTDG